MIRDIPASPWEQTERTDESVSQVLKLIHDQHGDDLYAAMLVAVTAFLVLSAVDRESSRYGYKMALDMVRYWNETVDVRVACGGTADGDIERSDRPPG